MANGIFLPLQMPGFQRHDRIQGFVVALQVIEPQWLTAESWQSPVECT
jgi:hypothetical protein